MIITNLKYMRRSIAISICLSVYLLSYSQQDQLKYEREEKVKVNIIPAPVGDFVEGCGFTERVIYYREYSQDGISYEAKVRQDGIQYSIEFDDQGTLQDVELGIKWDSIPESTQAQIRQYLDSAFQRHRLKKIQQQWTGPAMELQKLIREADSGNHYSTQYEIVLRGRTNGKTDWYEILFSEEGKLVRRSVFVPRNTDNLDY